MRISDWRSDVCSSDLLGEGHHAERRLAVGEAAQHLVVMHRARGELDDRLDGDGETALQHRLAQGPDAQHGLAHQPGEAQIGSASCRDRECQYVKMTVDDVTIKKKKTKSKTEKK